MDKICLLRDCFVLAVFTCMFSSFLLSGLVINSLQLLLWVLVRPWSRWLYRKINYYLLYCLWMQVNILFDWSGSKCNVFTDDETWTKMGTENALLLLNHSNELDWLVVWILSQQCNILGNCKLFIKKTVEWIPIIGWAWKFAEIGFLERNWDKDARTMDTFVKNIHEYTDPVWLLFFPEGTRFTREKHAVSMDYAERAGLPRLLHLLTPRTKGFSVLTDRLRGKFESVYSATLCFDTKMSGYPTLMNVFLGRPICAEVFLERIPFADIPNDPKLAAEWLVESFNTKDRLMDAYGKQGTF